MAADISAIRDVACATSALITAAAVGGVEGRTVGVVVVVVDDDDDDDD